MTTDIFIYNLNGNRAAVRDYANTIASMSASNSNAYVMTRTTKYYGQSRQATTSTRLKPQELERVHSRAQGVRVCCYKQYNTVHRRQLADRREQQQRHAERRERRGRTQPCNNKLPPLLGIHPAHSIGRLSPRNPPRSFGLHALFECLQRNGRRLQRSRISYILRSPRSSGTLPPYC